MEHKAKQEAIVKNVVTEMQRLLKQEMEEMTEMFSEKVISLTAKANSMRKMLNICLKRFLNKLKH